MSNFCHRFKFHASLFATEMGKSSMSEIACGTCNTIEQKIGKGEPFLPPTKEKDCLNALVHTFPNENTSKKQNIPSWTTCISSFSSLASRSAPPFKEKLIWKAPSPAFQSFDCFLPPAATLSPPWWWLLLSRFIHNSITFEEGSARGTVCSWCPRLGLEEGIFLSHSHRGNWSNFQTRLGFTTAHQENIEMTYTIYPHPLRNILEHSHWRDSAVRHVVDAFNDISGLQG